MADVQMRAVVPGLHTLGQGLRRTKSELAPKLRALLLELALGEAENVKDRARSLGGIAAHVVDGIGGRAAGDAASITLDPSVAPGILGAEFGAGHNRLRNRSTGSYLGYNQFGPWLGNGPDTGTFLWPQLREDEPQIASTAARLIDELLAPTFPD